MAAWQSLPEKPLVSTLVSPLAETVISMVFTVAPLSDLDTNADTAIGQQVLGSRVTSLSSFQLGLFYSVGLQELIQLLLLAPLATVVIEIDFSGVGIAHGRVVPASELYGPADFFADKQLGRPVDWSRQLQTRAGRLNSQRVAYLGTNGHDM